MSRRWLEARRAAPEQGTDLRIRPARGGLTRTSGPAGFALPAVARRGCPAYSDRRGRIVMVTAQRLPDGSMTHPKGEPGPCERCGIVPEFIIEIVETVADGQTSEQAVASSSSREEP